MKKFEITKEQIIELINCSNQIKVDYRLKEWFPQAFESELEVGKWYKSTDNDGFMFYINESEENKYIGYGKLQIGGEFHHEWWFHKDSVYGKSLVPATDKEVETALIAEAKRRGFKDNIKITHDGLLNECGKPIPKGQRNILNSKFEYEENVLRQNGHIIYSNGKWAEIISEPIEVTLEEIADKFGVNVEQLKIKK